MPADHPSDLRYPSIDGLRAFEAAARLGSFERAAEALNVTAGAVGKRIATLEQLLGGPLLLRGGKTLGLSAEGKEYLAQARAALALLATVPLHQRTVQRRQRLRVTSPPTFARQLLMPVLGEFSQAHPEIELELMLSVPYLDDTSGARPLNPEHELVVRHGDPQAAGVAPLLQDVLIPMAAPALLARLPALQQPADLAQAPLLRSPLDPWTPWFRAAGLDHWAEPCEGPKLVDLGLALEAAAHGQGVVLGRPSLARAWLASGALRPLFGLHTVPRTHYHLASLTSPASLAPAPGDPTDPSATAVFGHWLAQACARQSAEAMAVLAQALARAGQP